MTQTTKPSAQSVRDWMGNLIKDRAPPPTPEQIRRQLGWLLIPANKHGR